MTEREKLIKALREWKMPVMDSPEEQILNGYADFILADRKAVLERVRHALMGGDRPRVYGIASHSMYIECVDEAIAIIDRAVKTMER